MVYLGRRGILAGLPRSVLGLGTGLSQVRLGLLVPVAHDGLGPWAAWFSPFQLVVGNLGEVLITRSAGPQTQDVRKPVLVVILFGPFQQLWYLRKHQLPRRGDGWQGECSMTSPLAYLGSTTLVCVSVGP